MLKSKRMIMKLPTKKKRSWLRFKKTTTLRLQNSNQKTVCSSRSSLRSSIKWNLKDWRIIKIDWRMQAERKTSRTSLMNSNVLNCWSKRICSASETKKTTNLIEISKQEKLRQKLKPKLRETNALKSFKMKKMKRCGPKPTTELRFRSRFQLIRRKMRLLVTSPIVLNWILTRTPNSPAKWRANVVKKRLFVYNTNANNVNCKAKPWKRLNLLTKTSARKSVVLQTLTSLSHFRH